MKEFACLFYCLYADFETMTQDKLFKKFGREREYSSLFVEFSAEKRKCGFTCFCLAAHALAHLQDLLSLNFKGDPYSDGRYYSKPQKNPDGVNPNEKVDQLLIQLQYPM